MMSIYSSHEVRLGSRRSIHHRGFQGTSSFSKVLPLSHHCGPRRPPFAFVVVKCQGLCDWSGSKASLSPFRSIVMLPRRLWMVVVAAAAVSGLPFPQQDRSNTDSAPAYDSVPGTGDHPTGSSPRTLSRRSPNPQAIGKLATGVIQLGKGLVRGQGSGPGQGPGPVGRVWNAVQGISTLVGAAAGYQQIFPGSSSYVRILTQMIEECEKNFPQVRLSFRCRSQYSLEARSCHP